MPRAVRPLRPSPRLCVPSSALARSLFANSILRWLRDIRDREVEGCTGCLVDRFPVPVELHCRAGRSGNALLLLSSRVKIHIVSEVCVRGTPRRWLVLRLIVGIVRVVRVSRGPESYGCPFRVLSFHRELAAIHLPSLLGGPLISGTLLYSNRIDTIRRRRLLDAIRLPRNALWF